MHIPGFPYILGTMDIPGQITILESNKVTAGNGAVYSLKLAEVSNPVSKGSGIRYWYPD